MLEDMLAALPLSRLPKLPVWQARSIVEGNQIYALLHELEASTYAYSAARSPADPPRGFSIGARRPVTFSIRSNPDGTIEWRESTVCPITQLNTRMRAAYHLLVTLLPRPEACELYLTEQQTPLFELLASQSGRVTGSDYLPGVPLGTRDHRGVRSEDLTALTFADASFDALISLDVLEHVPDYRAALAECARVLRLGGRAIITAPFVWQQDHIVRARVTAAGEIEHLLPPDYHGDPIKAGGILCYYHFGWEMLDDLKAAGFSDAYVALVCSREFGYLGHPHSLFVATR